MKNATHQSQMQVMKETDSDSGTRAQIDKNLNVHENANPVNVRTAPSEREMSSILEDASKGVSDTTCAQYMR
jgi:hypothetical protein